MATTKFAPTALAAAAIGLGASSTTVTNNSWIPVNVRPGVIDTAETFEPAAPIQHVPLDVLNTDAQIRSAP